MNFRGEVSLQGLEASGLAVVLRECAPHGPVEDVVDEGRLARARDARDGDETVARNRDGEVLEVVLRSPLDRPAAVFGRPGAFFSAFDAPSSRQVVRREGRIFRAQRGARLAVELDGAALFARARPQIHHAVGGEHHLRIVFDRDHGVPRFGHAADDAACRHVLHVLPAQGQALFPAFRALDAVAGLAPHGLARQAHAGQALGRGEDDTAVAVVPGIGLVLAHDRELDTVDGLQLLQAQAQGPGHQHVYLHQGLPPGIVRAQGALPLPVGCQAAKKLSGRRASPLEPGLLRHLFREALLPQGRIVRGQAGQQQGPHHEREGLRGVRQQGKLPNDRLVRMSRTC